MGLLLKNLLSMIPNHMFPNNRVGVSNEECESFKLEFDLGITGDDAEDFIYKLKDKFQLSTDEFDFSNYFLNENQWYILKIEKILNKQLIKRKELTIRCLIAAIEKKEFI